MLNSSRMGKISDSDWNILLLLNPDWTEITMSSDGVGAWHMLRGLHPELRIHGDPRLAHCWTAGFLLGATAALHNGTAARTLRPRTPVRRALRRSRAAARTSSARLAFATAWLAPAMTQSMYKYVTHDQYKGCSWSISSVSLLHGAWLSNSRRLSVCKAIQRSPNWVCT
jgi:hypothetical protein